MLSGKKFGTANRHTTSAVSKIAAAFHRVKNNMEFAIPRYGPLPAACPATRMTKWQLALSSFTGSPLARTSRHHRAHLPHPHAVGDLDLDLVVVDHLGDLADEAAIGDDRIAAAQRFDHRLMLLDLLLLRPQAPGNT